MRLHRLFPTFLATLLITFLAACGGNNAATPAATAPVSATQVLTATVNVPATPTIAQSATLTVSPPVTATAVLTATAGSDGAPLTETLTLTTTPVTTTTAEPVLIPTDTPTTTTTVTTTTDTVPDDSTGAAPGTLLSAAFVERVSAAAVDQASQLFYPAANLLDANYEVDIYRLQVQSSTETGEPIDLQTDVYIPQVNAATALPVVAYAPGTTGLGDGCAPSQEVVLGRAWGGYYTHMLSYAGQGFIGVIPDGMSYDDPERPHEYFISELEAHTLLDATRGALAFLAAPPEGILAQPLDAIFLAGYSNGGHTAFAAKDFAADYAPELPIAGVISHGATTNVETLMRESPLFSPYLVYAYQFFYGSEVITPEQVFAANWLPTFSQDVNTKCVDEIFAYYSNDQSVMYNAAFRSALNNGELADTLPLFKTVLDANYAGTFGGFDIPVVFFQGTADATVTPRAQQQFARDLCTNEQPVTYVALPTVRHVDTRQSSFVATIEWMRNIVDGGAPENNCGDLAEE
jgi:hypothetical protein